MLVERKYKQREPEPMSSPINIPAYFHHMDLFGPYGPHGPLQQIYLSA